MAWIGLMLLAFLYAVCCAGGVWLGGRTKKVALATALLSLAAIFVRVACRFRPTLEYPLLAAGFYSAIQPYCFFPFAFVMVGIGIRRMGRKLFRAGMVAAAVALFAVALSRPWARATFEPSDYTGVAGSDGVCRQTQEYTCGPASAATLLTQLGIRTNELEMERLCGATPLTGADEVTLCRALRTKLSATGFRVTIERPDLDRLARYLRPVLVRMKSDLLRDHWVVLLAMNDRTVMLGDPLLGRVQMPVSEFCANWRGIVIAAGRPPFVPYAMR